MQLLMQFWWQYLIVAIGSFLIGSINFSVIFSNAIKKQDIRQAGSGNAGTTNMFRVFGWSMGALTFLFDCSKGVLCCLIARLACGSLGYQSAVLAQYIAGLFVVVGHIFPIYYRFNGGKGFATTIGVLFFSQPLLMLAILAGLIVIILITDRMSVAAMLFAIFISLWYWLVLFGQVGLIVCIIVALISACILFAHRANFVRICKGEELPTGVRKSFFKKSRRGK